MVRVRSIPAGNQLTGLVVPVVLLAAIFLGAGCSPKKVTNNDPVVPKQVASKSQNTQDIQIPSPTPKGKSGRAPDQHAVGQKPSPTTTATANQAKKSSTSSSPMGLKAASFAKKQLGKQYKWGAEGPDRFDCSGLTLFVYKNVGVQLPRNSRAQAKVGKVISRKDLQPGDLLFFATSGKTINHVGIYVGGSKFVHAPRKYNPVRTDSLNNSYWRQRLKVARRVG